MNRNIDIDWVQVAKYLSGECSPEEKAVIEARLMQDHAFKAKIEEAGQAWKATRRPDEGIDKKRAWIALQERVKRQEDRSMPLKLVQHANRTSKSTRLQYLPFEWLRKPRLALATCLVLLVTVSFFYLQKNNSLEPASSEYALFKTTAGQQSSITLPDGSKAILNVESQMRILSSPSDAVRLIELQGEAFFNVKSDLARPFIVRVGEADVQVLGTSFNVAAYPEQEGVQVAVAEGEVKLQRRGEEASVILQQNDIGVLSESGNPTSNRDISIDRLLAWKDGHLVFEKTNFEEVARELERWFDLEIHSESDFSNRHLTAAFEDPSPNHVVSTVATTLGLDYSIEGRIVTFSTPMDQ